MVKNGLSGMVKKRLSAAAKVSAGLVDRCVSGRGARRNELRAIPQLFEGRAHDPTPLCEGADAAYLRSQVREWDRDGQSGIVRPNKSRQQETSAMISSMNFARGFATCLAALTWGGIGTASALDYPPRPVRRIVTYTTGWGKDIP